MHTVEPGIWRVTPNNLENKKCTLWKQDSGGKPENVENETQTLYDRKYG